MASKMMKPEVPFVSLLITVAAFAAVLSPLPVAGIENKCGACVVIQHELMDILVQERPRSNLDLRNRLNSQGKREGKIVDYKYSELRIVEILEGLCVKMKKYSIKPLEDKKRVWTHGETHSTDRLRLIAEEQGKELNRWCHRLLEEYEDDMAALIREEMKQAYKELPIILCRNITGSCKDEETYMAELDFIAKHLPRSSGDSIPNIPGMPNIQVKEAPADEKDPEEGDVKVEL